MNEYEKTVAERCAGIDEVETLGSYSSDVKYDVWADGTFVAKMKGSTLYGLYGVSADEIAFVVDEHGRCDVEDDNGRTVTFVLPGSLEPEDRGDVVEQVAVFSSAVEWDSRK